ncbi:uncharacterized protein LOC131182065 [Hevea brasiliensis]|uniref:uncharacterized protein LOC131182065 n=1 Tax=Hevea brasiliensis TaxID=3981 RepID=UPI0025F6F412|nr:uncharacterized protein LOC131182065 [Hevea brasiliensis]
MGSARPQANVSEAMSVSEDTAITGMFSNEELQTLRRFLSQVESQSTIVASSNFVNSGKEKVCIADGSLSNVSGTGSVKCTPTISLSSLLHDATPNVFGCVCFVHQPNRGKLEPRALKYVFVESLKSRGRLNRSDLRIYTQRNKIDIAIEQVTANQSDLWIQLLNILRKGVRTCSKHPISNFISYDSLSPPYRAILLSVFSVSITQDWKKACLDPKWKAAIVEEMKALAKNET